MPNPRSTTLTPWLAERFAGVLSRPYTMRWDQNQFPWDDLEPVTTDDAGVGNIEFTTSIEVTGEISQREAFVAAARLWCIYAIFKMTDKGLAQATQSIGDILSWEDESSKVRMIESPKPKKIAAKAVLPAQTRPITPFEEL